MIARISPRPRLLWWSERGLFHTNILRYTDGLLRYTVQTVIEELGDQCNIVFAGFSWEMGGGGTEYTECQISIQLSELCAPNP